MFEFGAPALWMAVAGGLGGFLNGAFSHNVFLWPRRLAGYHPPMRIVRPGLAVNLLIGTIAAAVVFWIFAGETSLAWPAGRLMLALPTAGIIGGLAARWATNEADKRVLRAALVKACAAPAAHPEICTIVASAPPHKLLEIADDLAPRFRGLR